MSTWIRAVRELRCGNCGERIPVGDPALVFRGRPPATWRSYRCGLFDCARVAIPENLPALPPRPEAAGPLPLLRFSADMLPLDFKAQAAGERLVSTRHSPTPEDRDARSETDRSETDAPDRAPATDEAVAGPAEARSGAAR